MALALVVAACGGATPPPEEPELEANPPDGSSEGIAKGAAQTDLDRAVAYIDNGDFAKAKPYLESAIKASPENAEAYAFMGFVLEKEKDVAGAEKAYLAALERKPGHGPSATNLAGLYLAASPPRVDDAIKVLQRALEKGPGDVAVLQNLGYALGLKGDVEGASKAYEAAIAKGDSTELRFAYATMLSDAKQHDKAVPHLKKVLAATKDTKDDLPTLATVGRMLGFGLSFGDCVAAFDRAIKLKSDDPELFVRRGTCKHGLKDEAGALADFQASVKVKPDYAAGYYYMGVSQSLMEKPQSAEFSMQKAVEYGKDSPSASSRKQKLKELQAKNKR